MRLTPRRPLIRAVLSSRFACGLCFFLISGLAANAQQVQVPIAQILFEAEANVKAKKPGDAAPLFDMVLSRVDKGETLRSGQSLDRIEFQAAAAFFQVENYERAISIAQKSLGRVSSGTVASDIRLVLGLSLALQKKYTEAVTVFAELENSPKYREKALLYRAMAAQAAGQPDVAIDALTRTLKFSAHNGDWADAVLSLIALQLQQKNLPEARAGLEALRGSLDLVDNVVGLNALSLQLGDTLIEANDIPGALTAYRTVFPRETVLSRQKKQNARMEALLAQRRAIAGAGADDADSVRRLDERLKATKVAMAEIEARADYNAFLYYRLGNAFYQRGGTWEAALLFERLLDEFPICDDRERAYLAMVRSYAESGRVAKMSDAINRFARAAPNSELLAQALFVGAQSASDGGRVDLQMKFLETGVNQFGKSPLREFMLIMQANAHFTVGHFDQARTSVENYLVSYPEGRFAEDALYLRAMSSLVTGSNKQGITEIGEYLKKYPEGRFVSDARFRIASAEFALQDYDAASKHVSEWLADYPDNSQRGEVLSLQGDIYAGQQLIDQAIKSYRAALSLPLSDDLLGYVLDELTKHYQARREFNEAVLMWKDFAREKPDHPFVVNAAYWIGRLRAREGKTDEAIAQMSAIAIRYVGDPSRDSLERLLSQIAAFVAKPAKSNAGGKRSPVPTMSEVEQRIAGLFLAPVPTASKSDNSNENDVNALAKATTEARVLFTTAEVASFRKDKTYRDALLTRIAENPPEALPPGILGSVADLLYEQGKVEQAKSFYDYLVTRYSKSIYADFGYVGLGEIAYAAGNYDTAYTQFSNAIDRAGARFKLMEATLGRAKTLFAQGKLDQAKELFEQVASNRQWRGASTAQSVYSLGAILEKRGGSENLAQAQAHFQRVYLSYRKFTPWVARAYLSSGETFEKLGQLKEALATYQEMLRDERLAGFPETEKARARADELAKQLKGGSA